MRKVARGEYRVGWEVLVSPKNDGMGEREEKSERVIIA